MRGKSRDSIEEDSTRTGSSKQLKFGGNWQAVLLVLFDALSPCCWWAVAVGGDPGGCHSVGLEDHEPPGQVTPTQVSAVEHATNSRT